MLLTRPRTSLRTARRGGVTAAFAAAWLAAVVVAGDYGHGALLRTRRFAAAPTLSLDQVRRLGLRFEAYAEALQTPSATLLSADIGGLLYGSRLHVIDLAGLIDRDIAALAPQGSATLRQHLLSVERPTFIAVRAWWAEMLALHEDPVFRRDYATLREVPGDDPTGTVRLGDYVRRDAVADAGALADPPRRSRRAPHRSIANSLPIEVPGNSIVAQYPSVFDQGRPRQRDPRRPIESNPGCRPTEAPLASCA